MYWDLTYVPTSSDFAIYLQVNPKGHKIQQECYWRLDFIKPPLIRTIRPKALAFKIASHHHWLVESADIHELCIALHSQTFHFCWIQAVGRTHNVTQLRRAHPKRAVPKEGFISVAVSLAAKWWRKIRDKFFSGCRTISGPCCTTVSRAVHQTPTTIKLSSHMSGLQRIQQQAVKVHVDVCKHTRHSFKRVLDTSACF